MNALKLIFKRGYNREWRTENRREELKRFGLYMVRWQMSTPILAFVTHWLSGLGYLWSAVVANLIGSMIFYWVDKFIFKPEKKDGKNLQA